MKDVCRICARELNGNQRRWIFHPTAKLSLQVLLSYALGREMTRDGRGEFACSKCAFMLDRMYRFDTVIARVEALSVERMQKLLLEKDRLRQCIGGLYRKNNADDFGVDSGAADSSVVDFSRLAEAEYNALLQEDLAYSVYESWAEHDTQEQVQDHQCLVHQCHAAADATLGPRPRKCKGCAALRVADSDYEAVCKVPRKVGRSTSCGPSTRYSGSVQDSAEETISSVPPPETEPEESNQSRQPSDPEPVCVSPASSVESLDTAVDVTQESNPKVHPNTVQGESEEERSAIKMPSSVCGIDMALSLLKSFEYHPLQSHRGSRIPVLLKPITTPMESSYPLLQVSSIGIECPISPHLPDAPSSIQQELQLELAEMEELWLDDYVQCKPLGLQKKLQQRLGDMESELRSLREAACGQERTIQTLSDSLNTKDCEVCLPRKFKVVTGISGFPHMLETHCLAFGLLVSRVPPSRLQADLLDLQGSLFSAQLELQGLQSAQQQGQRREEDLARAYQRLQADLQRALQHHQEAERHNQDLQAALEKARFEVQQMEEKWRDEWKQREKEAEERKRTIRELKTSLEHKERLIEVRHAKNILIIIKSLDNLIHKLKQRIQERDRALERAIDDKFTCMEQKEDEVRKLQLLLREKERDLEKLRCVLSNNEETITSLELLLRGKGLALEQVCEAWHNAQSVPREKEESHMRSLRERDTLISQLQTSLHTRTKEVEEMTAVLLSEVSVGSNEVAEELKSRLQLKEHLFQELLSDRSRQTQEHHSQVQDLLNTINAREQYIRDSAGRVGQVMAEQTARLQELRRQLGSANPQSTEADTQTLQDELRLTLRREREAQNQLTALHVTLASLQDQLKTQASDIEALSRTVSIKEEIIKDLQMQLVDPSDLPLVEQLTQELQMLREKVEHQDATCINHKVSISTKKSCDQHRGLKGCQDAVAEGPGLAEVKLLVEQRRAVERELMELKSQLEKAGFSSLSQMRYSYLYNKLTKGYFTNNKSSMGFYCKLSYMFVFQPNEREPVCDQTVRLKSNLEQVQQESRELQERLMVSEATVQAQAEQLKDYRELLTETSVQQDNKQVQVDIQDLGYETCGRSENEAEREDTSSPEFDDLELCTSLSYRDGGSQWWGGPSSLNSGKTKHDVTYLQQLVEDLRGQLSQSQALIHSLQAQTRDHTPVSTPRKVNWGLDNSEAQSTAEEDEGWQSSDGFGSLPRQPKQDRELQELVSRVTSLEEQLRKGKGHSEDGKAVNWPGKFDTLIQAQARELSHLRQRMREGRGVCHILTQHLGDTTKTFEELLRSNDIDYYMGQSFRDQLSQSISLAQRVSTKISGRDHSEVPDDKSGHELLAIRLSKELQQKDKLIESLRSKLDQQQPRSDMPTSSHALSVATDQSDRTSFVSDGHGSTSEDLELCSELDAASEYGQEEAARSATVSLSEVSVAVSLCVLPLGLSTAPLSSSISFSTSLHCPEMSSAPVFDPQTQPLRTRHTYGGGFSLAEVHQELQMLQRQLGNSEPASECVWHRMIHTNSATKSLSARFEPLTGIMLLEIRTLRRRLEGSIQTNDSLRQQLEERLASSGRNGGQRFTQSYSPSQCVYPGILYLYVFVCIYYVLQLHAEGSKEMERLREVVLSGRGQLKQAELEADRWADQCRQLQAQNREQAQAILQLKQEKQYSLDNSTRLQHDVNVLQQQLSECQCLVHTLQCELQVYQRVCGTTESNTGKKQIHLSDTQKSGAEALEVEAPDGSCKTGRHMIGHMDDFSALQQQLLEGKAVIHEMSFTRGLSLQGYMRNLHTSTKTLKQILEETSSLLRIFWRAALPSTETSAQQLKKEQSLKKEAVTLRRKLSEQEQLLRDTMENLRTSSRTKDNMEQFIVNQLSRTRNVLKQARSNLEVSLFYHSYIMTLAVTLCSGEVSGASLQHASSLGWNFVTPHTQDQHKSVTASWLAQGSDRQRLLQVSCRTDSRLSAAVSPSF
uniref:Si:ch211-242b18.1 n=1 Tax=Sinocyclocheilus anshuiensis TaxID=1608454 RepID=A0A671PKJ9_9TELE